MTQASPCLLCINKTSTKYRHFPFLEEKITIGRAADATFPVLSNTISRYHAIIEKQGENIWTVTDNKSLNGIAVNDKRLEASEPYTLQDGDIVQFGVPASPGTPAEFAYRFFTSLKVRREPAKRKKRPCAEDGSPPKRLKRSSGPGDKMEGSSQETERGGWSKKGEGSRSSEALEMEERLNAEYKKQLRTLTKRLKKKEEEKSAIFQQLLCERKEKKAIEEKHKRQAEKVSQLDAKQRQLEEEKAAAGEQIRHQMEKRLQEQEVLLRNQMQKQIESLAAEKIQVEKRLQREMQKAVKEKNQELQNCLQGEKDRLQKIIDNKELEQKALENQLEQSRMEKEKARADTLAAREAVLAEFAETMETELQCSICSELFVQATSLNCSHAFCALCIRQWLAVKKECPNCRVPVTSQMRSIVLDSYIDRMVEQLSEDMKQRRAELMEERKEAEAKLDEAENQQQAGPSGTGARGRGMRRGRRRAGRGRRGRGAATTTAAGNRGVDETVGPPRVSATITHYSQQSTDNEGAAGPSDVSDTDPEFVITDSEEEQESSESDSEHLDDTDRDGSSGSSD